MTLRAALLLPLLVVLLGADRASAQQKALTAGALTLPALGSALLYERSHNNALQPSSPRARSSAVVRVLLELLYGGLGGL